MSPEARPTHACPGGCGAKVTYAQLACRTCWFRLPVTIRREVTAGWVDNKARHRAAVVVALAWYRDDNARIADLAAHARPRSTS